MLGVPRHSRILGCGPGVVAASPVSQLRSVREMLGEPSLEPMGLAPRLSYVIPGDTDPLLWDLQVPLPSMFCREPDLPVEVLMSNVPAFSFM
jgi:hypothetical protein